MRKRLSLLLLPLFFTNCASMNSSPKEEKHKMELTVTKLRSDIEELRHDLNSNQMEMHILEGKLTSQDSAISHIKSQSVELQQLRIDQLVADVTQLEKQMARLSKKQEEVVSDIRQLTIHANEMTAALTQYKQKISEAEVAISAQEMKLAEISQIKTKLKELAVLAAESTLDTSAISYTVQSGDTLEKIARHFKTTPSEIIRKNNLKDQHMIYAGQEIIIPTSGR